MIPFWRLARLPPRAALGLACLVAAEAAAQAKAPVNTDQPPGLAAYGLYTRRMSREYGTRGSLERCRFGRLSLTQVDSIRLRWFHHWISLPTGFTHGPMRLRYDSVWHPLLQARWVGQEWLPDLFVEPVDWYRWSRAHPGNTPVRTLPGTLIQLRQYRNYPVVLARPPWSVTDAEECEWSTLNEGARVMRFTLVHPEQPPQWVVTAAWYGRREPTARGFLSIGPDEASQAEALEILRLLRPDDGKAQVSLPRRLAEPAKARASNPAVRLQVEPDPAAAGQSVLVVDYPPPSENPAARDVWVETDLRDWSAAPAITFQVKPSQPTTVSVSFFDRNRVVYTTRAELRDTTWQMVRVVFDSIRPNPYFQPPDAKTGAPLDVKNMDGFAFAPQGSAGGRLMVRGILLTN